MRHAATTFLLFLGLTLTLVSSVVAPASPVYSLTVSPGFPVSRGTTVTLILSISNGQANGAYGVSIGVTKPNGTGQASTSRIISTDNRGVGSTSVPYPDASFTPVNGTVATDISGVYTVRANQTSPSLVANVATATFTVTSTLTVVLSAPITGIYVQRGQKVTITATVSDLSGPITSATAYANTPPGGIIYLTQVTSGVYSGDYQVLMYDPVGPWTVRVSASDTRGNSGVSGTATVTITKSDLVIDSLVAYNSKGLPSTDFSQGDTIYPFFRIRYSSGPFLTSGQFRVSVKNPSGTVVANLTAVYDTARFGFSTPTGYPVSTFDPSGSWSIVIDANSANDGFGNTGPNFTTSINTRVSTVASTWAYLLLIIGGVIGSISGAVAFKKYDKSVAGFEYLEELTGGPFPRASSLLLLGDPGSGKTIFSYQFLYDELESGRQCALLSYDAFPEDVQSRMKEFGWDITSHLRKGRFKVIDCYSGLSGEGEGAIKDPSDLTELNIRVTSIIARAKGNPVTLALDSLTPIFNGVDARQALMFLQTVAAKIKKTGGIFYMTGSTGAISSDSLAKLKSMVDGVIELSLLRVHRHASRYLTVEKMERRKISQETVPFEIDRKRGIVFRVSRVNRMFSRRPEVEPTPLTPKALQKIATPRGEPKPPLTRLEAKADMAKADSRVAVPKGEKVEPPKGGPRPDAGKPEDKPGRTGFFGRLRAVRDKLWRVPAPSRGIPAAKLNAPRTVTIQRGDLSAKPESATRPSQGPNSSRSKNESRHDTDSTPTDETEKEPADNSRAEPNSS